MYELTHRCFNSRRGHSCVAGGCLVAADGVEKVNPHGGLIAEAGDKLVVDGREMIVSDRAEAVSALTLALAGEGTSLTLAHIAKLDANTQPLYPRRNIAGSCCFRRNKRQL